MLRGRRWCDWEANIFLAVAIGLAHSRLFQAMSWQVGQWEQHWVSQQIQEQILVPPLCNLEQVTGPQFLQLWKWETLYMSSSPQNICSEDPRCLCVILAVLATGFLFNTLRLRSSETTMATCSTSASLVTLPAHLCFSATANNRYVSQCQRLAHVPPTF